MLSSHNVIYFYNFYQLTFDSRWLCEHSEFPFKVKEGGKNLKEGERTFNTLSVRVIRVCCRGFQANPISVSDNCSALLELLWSTPSLGAGEPAPTPACKNWQAARINACVELFLLIHAMSYLLGTCNRFVAIASKKDQCCAWCDWHAWGGTSCLFCELMRRR